MTDAECRKAAKAFAEYWKDRGDEKSDSRSFWLAFVREVLGVAEPGVGVWRSCSKNTRK